MPTTAAQPATDIYERTFQFSLRVVRLCKHLNQQRGVARIFSRQVLRSATSIGANLEEAKAAHSRPDFICKVEIALKEARETAYWLRLAIESETVSKARAGALHSEAQQLCRILGAIVVSTKRNSAS